MRRKSERTASKKTKPSPEKKEKVEKTKHSRSRRRKQSSSSASEAEEPPASVEVTESVEVKATEPPKSANEESSKESQDQVWQVKSTESSGDVGEIQKLKLCLARPSSTPERVDRSPRSKRKHTRATSSSDTQSVEGEEKKKSRRHSKRSDASKDLDNKNDESQNEETELDIKEASPQKSSETKTDQSSDQNKSNDETPASTTNEEIKSDKEEPSETDKTEDTTEEDNTAETETSQDTKVTDKPSDTEAVTTSTSDSESASPNKAVPTSPDKAVPTSPNKAVTTSPNKAVTTSPNKAETTSPNKPVTTSTNKEVPTSNEEVPTSPKSDDKEQKVSLPSAESPIRKRSLSAEKSEILELHAEESRCESSEVSFSESQDARSKTALEEEDKDVSSFDPGEVSINKSTTEISGQPGSNSEDKVTTDNIEDSHKSDEKESTPPDSTQDDAAKDMETARASLGNKEENSQPTPDIPNGEVTPLVANRKRRWGSRPSKLSTQKSITISTDVLKEIIPDVKPAEFDEVIEEKKHKRIEVPEKIDRPILPKIIIDNTENANNENNKRERKVEDKDKENVKAKDSNLASSRKISIVKEQDSIIARPPSPPRHKQSSILYITNLVRPFTLPQLKNLLQRTGKIVENGFWIDRIKSKCYVKYDTEDQAVETRHALHGVTWPVSNPKTLHVDFSTQEDFDKAKANEDTDNAKASTIPGTVEDWLREQDMKREKGELEKPWERKAAMREWDVGKNEKTKEVVRPDKNHRDERPLDKRRHRSIERSPEPARKFKKKEEEAPAKLLDDLFRKTKATPCIYWLPLSAETIAIKEEQRRQHMAEHERRLQELRRTQRRH